VKIDITLILQTILTIIIPIFVIWSAKQSKIVRTISPVVVCYIFGMLLGSQGALKFDSQFSIALCGIAVALAIPLLLFSVDFIAWSRLAGTTLLSFLFCVLSTVIASTIAHFIFIDKVAESAKMAGMLAGVYIGCTGNMNAIGIMLGAKPETFVMLNTSDMLLSLIYLAFLMTVAGRILGKFLPAFPYTEGKKPDDATQKWDEINNTKWPRVKELAPSVLLTIAIVAVCAAVKYFMPQNIQDTIFILAITTLGLLFSFVPKVRAFKGTQPMGQYLMLVFFLAIGVTSDLGKLFSSSLIIFIFDLVVIVGSIGIHLLLCAIFRIDRDTAIITSTATIFSPPFVPSVAMALKNKEILVSGIATGLVGYAVANYVGVTLAWFLQKMT